MASLWKLNLPSFADPHDPDDCRDCWEIEESPLNSRFRQTPGYNRLALPRDVVCRLRAAGNAITWFPNVRFSEYMTGVSLPIEWDVHGATLKDILVFLSSFYKQDLDREELEHLLEIDSKDAFNYKRQALDAVTLGKRVKYYEIMGSLRYFESMKELEDDGYGSVRAGLHIAFGS
jgi:hypothetical protein